MSKKTMSPSTVEEHLNKALIPEEEQSYEVPMNWVWTRCGELSEVIRGVSYKKHQVQNEKNNQNCLILRGGNIQDGEILNQDDNVYVDRSIVNQNQFLMENDIVLVSSTGSSKVIGKAASVTPDFVDESFGAFMTLVRPNEKINKQFFGYYFQSNSYRKVISELAKGSNINNIKADYLQQLHFPLPPLKEQIRIADKIETLFAKLDEAKQLIEEVKDSFELRRKAVLKRAFNGELIKFTVKLERLVDIVTLKSGKSLSDDDLVKDGVFPYVKVADMNSVENQKEIVSSSNAFIVEKENLLKSIFPKGTVVFPKRGGAIHTNKKRILSIPAMCDLNIMGIICPPDMNPYYMYYWMQGIDLRSLDNGTSVPQINNKDIEPLLFPLTSLENQNKVVKLLDSIFEKEDEFIEMIESRLIQLDELKQSLLNKAFRGELGTNELTEESSIELLKDIIESIENKGK
jgi:type I restriction enzyme, S subunit